MLTAAGGVRRSGMDGWTWGTGVAVRDLPNMLIV